MEEAIDEIRQTQVGQLLARIRDLGISRLLVKSPYRNRPSGTHIVISYSKRPRNSHMLKRGCHKRRNRTRESLAKKLCVCDLWINACGDHFSYIEEIIVLASILVGRIANAGEEKKTDECSCDGKIEDELVLAAPALPGLLEDNKNDNTTEADTASIALDR